MFCFCNFTRGTSGVHNSRVRNGTVEVFSSPMLIGSADELGLFVFLTLFCGASSIGPAMGLRQTLSLSDDKGLVGGQLLPVVYTYYILLLLVVPVLIYTMFVYILLKGHSIKIDKRRVCVQSYLSIVRTSRLAAMRMVLYQTTIDVDDISNVAIPKHQNKSNDNNGADKSFIRQLYIVYVSRSKKSQLYKACELTLNPDVPETVLTALVQYISKLKQDKSYSIENINDMDDFISAVQVTEDPEGHDHSQRHIEQGKHYTMYTEGETTKLKLFASEGMVFDRYLLHKSKFYQVAFVVYLAIIGASVVRHIQLYGVSGKMIGYVGVLIPFIFVCILYIYGKLGSHNTGGSCDTLTLHEHSIVIQYYSGAVVDIQYQSIAELMHKQDIVKCDENDVISEVNKLEISYNDVQGKSRTVYITTSGMSLNEIQEIEEIIRQKITN